MNALVASIALDNGHACIVPDAELSSTDAANRKFSTTAATFSPIEIVAQGLDKVKGKA